MSAWIDYSISHKPSLNATPHFGRLSTTKVIDLGRFNPGAVQHRELSDIPFKPKNPISTHVAERTKEQNFQERGNEAPLLGKFGMPKGAAALKEGNVVQFSHVMESIDRSMKINATRGPTSLIQGSSKSDTTRGPTSLTEESSKDLKRKRQHNSPIPSPIAKKGSSLATSTVQEPPHALVADSLFLPPPPDSGEVKVVKDEHAVPKLREASPVLELRYRSSPHANHGCRRPILRNDHSPVRSSTSPFFRSILPRGQGGINKANPDPKQAIESFMLENGLLHPRCDRSRIDVKAVSQEMLKVIKSETSTEVGFEDEEEGCDDEDNNALGMEEDADVDSEPESRYEYAVIYRWWTDEDGEDNAHEHISEPFLSLQEANARAERCLDRPPPGLDPCILRGSRKPNITPHLGSELAFWRIDLGGGVITAEVQCTEVPMARRPPSNAVWIPREAFLLRCEPVRMTVTLADNILTGQGTRLSHIETEHQPAQIITTLPRANQAAGELWIDKRSEKLDKLALADVAKAIMRSEVLKDIREMTKNEALFDQAWTKDGVTTRIWVERCKVRGPRN